MHRSLTILCRLAALVAGALLIERLCVQPYAANLVLHRVDRRTHAALDAGDPQRGAILARTNLNELRSIASTCRYDVTYHFLFAANARFLNQSAEELAHYDAAMAVDHRPEIYFERGLTLLEMGRKAEAIPNLVTAARFDPGSLDNLDPQVREEVATKLER